VLLPHKENPKIYSELTKEQLKEALEDFSYIHLCESKEQFMIGYMLFKVKWSYTHKDFTDYIYCTYFEKYPNLQVTSSPVRF